MTGCCLRFVLFLVHASRSSVLGSWFLGLACARIVSTAAGSLRGGVTKQFYLSCPRNGGLVSGTPQTGGGTGGGAAICGLLTPASAFSSARWAVGNYDICICSSCLPRRRRRRRSGSTRRALMPIRVYDNFNWTDTTSGL